MWPASTTARSRMTKNAAGNVSAEVFVDTSAWYPIAIASHPDHERVVGALRDAVQSGMRLVTTNLVVAECHALLMRRVHRKAALTFVRTVREPPNLVVVTTVALEAAAVRDWLERFADQDYSFTDAVSFAAMAEREMTDALALDHHFSAAGFRLLPGGA